MLSLYSGMNSAMDQIIGDYDEAQLELLADFLRRTAEAGRAAARVDKGGLRREDVMCVRPDGAAEGR